MSMFVGKHTVDGKNPAPPWMVETLEIMGCLPPINCSKHMFYRDFTQKNTCF
jgi:hypothetical protein